MQPYSSPYYFVILIISLLPLIIAHAFGRKWMGYQVVVSIFLLWLTFGRTAAILPLLGFGVFETLIIKLYLSYRLKANKSWVFITATVLSILPLFIVKLTPLVDSAHPESFLGFLGISYVTFKTVGIILETRDGLIKEIPLKEYLYFLYFYPTISSGPIDRYRRFHKELTEDFKTVNYADYINRGFFYIFLGFLYKFIIGHIIDFYWLHGVAIQATLHPAFGNMVQSMFAYGLYLFFDFGGYSLFAIGTALLMGYDIPHNFKYPFAAPNIKDFWNRWHMTLSFWFRDFVAMRFAKWIMVKGFTKNRVLIANLGYLASMGLMGFWHGFTWYYIVYGFYHAGLLIAYDAWLRLKKKRKWKIPKNKLTSSISVGLTIIFVFIGFLIFSGIPNAAILHALGHQNVIPNF